MQMQNQTGTANLRGFKIGDDTKIIFICSFSHAPVVKNTEIIAKVLHWSNSSTASFSTHKLPGPKELFILNCIIITGPTLGRVPLPCYAMGELNL